MSRVESVNANLKAEFFVERNKRIQNAARLQILGEELNSLDTEGMEFDEKYECLKASLAEAEEATSVAHVTLMSASARYLDERKKSTRYKAKFKEYKQKLAKFFLGSP
jgi:hypothetical protein